MKFIKLLCLLAIIAVGCVTTETTDKPVSVKWELFGNDLDSNSRYKAQFTITNHQATPLDNSGWAIYYNQMNPGAVSETVTGGVAIEVVAGTFVKLYPTADFQPLANGKSVTITYEKGGYVTKKGDAPEGMYIVFDGYTPLAIDCEIGEFTKPEQIKRTNYDNYPIPTAEYLYEENKRIEELPYEQVIGNIIPTPVSIIASRGAFTISENTTISYGEGLDQEASYLSNILGDFLNKKPKITPDTDGDIVLNIDNINVNGKTSEAYHLEVGLDKVSITGSDAAGVFYGIQSLFALIEADDLKRKHANLKIGVTKIEDAPHFAYRGMMLDVSRNFQKKETVLKLLDMMAMYKLNKFHFHLTDDEGWRLEIPSIPELTEVGSKRGHTTDEKDRLYPMYGSGPFTDSWGSGYYTKADFIEILQHAKKLHIEVIPEIDLPGHARAAIKSMDVRYDKLMESGNEAYAKEYLLRDMNDKSKYTSAQLYHDNVICVCQESVYTFVEKVVDEVIAMYKEANVPLNIIHTGGDEVPSGSWSQSPVCEEFVKTNPMYKGEAGLTLYFTKRFGEILNQRGITTGGWEEIGLMRKDIDGHHVYEVNPSFVDANFQPYVWNAIFGWGGEDRAYQLANAGYDVVLCNASNFYFDLAYDKDPRENGLYWAGYVDTRKAFEFNPYDLFKSAYLGRYGEQLDPDNLAVGRTQLTEEGKKHILGLQGQLWGETIKGSEPLEYYIFPKLLGLAERAWTPLPTWTMMDDTKARREAVDIDWLGFANTLGQKEFKRLDYLHGGINYRIPKPGAIVKNGQLLVNMPYPGFTIRYTTDGSAPTVDSPIYEPGLEVDGEVRLRAFDDRGRGSLVTEVGGDVAN